MQVLGLGEMVWVLHHQHFSHCFQQTIGISLAFKSSALLLVGSMQPDVQIVSFLEGLQSESGIPRRWRPLLGAGAGAGPLDGVGAAKFHTFKVSKAEHSGV